MDQFLPAMGMLTRPKLMLPFQIARAIQGYFAARLQNARVGFKAVVSTVLSGSALRLPTYAASSS
ncbi:MAG: hypothetical protein DMC60_14235 [Verrucomicrobia bacterium]|nr:MAG: hypothetical protein DMC60_14235 [Verrucomicrobiota bacterium]